MELLIPEYTDLKLAVVDLDLRITSAESYVDFSSCDYHASIRFGLGDWPHSSSRSLTEN
jgi:hypothetical protein